jgi:hypothetical protein
MFSKMHMIQLKVSFRAFSVRPLFFKDFENLSLFLKELETPISDVETVMKHPETFILTVENRIVGVFIIELSHIIYN